MPAGRPGRACKTTPACLRSCHRVRDLLRDMAEPRCRRGAQASVRKPELTLRSGRKADIEGAPAAKATFDS